MANECVKKKISKYPMICPFCLKKLRKGETYYRYRIESPIERERFSNLFPRGRCYACEKCYSQFPEELKEIIEQRNFNWELDLEKGFWFNKETGEKEHFDE